MNSKNKKLKLSPLGKFNALNGGLPAKVGYDWSQCIRYLIEVDLFFKVTIHRFCCGELGKNANPDLRDGPNHVTEDVAHAILQLGSDCSKPCAFGAGVGWRQFRDEERKSLQAALEGYGGGVLSAAGFKLRSGDSNATSSIIAASAQLYGEFKLIYAYSAGFGFSSFRQESRPDVREGLIGVCKGMLIAADCRFFIGDAKDPEGKWITLHPNGEGTKGQPVRLDENTGKINAGLNGEHNGETLEEAFGKGKPAAQGKSAAQGKAVAQGKPSAKSKSAAQGKPAAKSKPAAQGKPSAKSKPAVHSNPAENNEPDLAQLFISYKGAPNGSAGSKAILSEAEQLKIEQEIGSLFPNKDLQEYFAAVRDPDWVRPDPYGQLAFKSQAQKQCYDYLQRNAVVGNGLLIIAGTEGHSPLPKYVLGKIEQAQKDFADIAQEVYQQNKERRTTALRKIQAEFLELLASNGIDVAAREKDAVKQIKSDILTDVMSGKDFEFATPSAILSLGQLTNMYPPQDKTELSLPADNPAMLCWQARVYLAVMENTAGSELKSEDERRHLRQLQDRLQQELPRQEAMLSAAEGGVPISIAVQRIMGRLNQAEWGDQNAYAPLSLAGVNRGPQMSFAEADQGACNPYFHLEIKDELEERLYSGYRDNCQSSVVAFEMRLRGFDVESQPSHEALRNQSEHLAKRPNEIWVDPSTGAPPDVTPLKDLGALKYVLQEGQRYCLQWSWKPEKGSNRPEGGHIISALRINGEIVLYDPQSGMTYDMESLEYQMAARGGIRKGSVELFRVDNCNIIQPYADQVLVPAHQDVIKPNKLVRGLMESADMLGDSLTNLTEKEVTVVATPEQIAAAKHMIEQQIARPGFSYVRHLGEYEGKEVFKLCFELEYGIIPPKVGWPVFALFDPATPDTFVSIADVNLELTVKLREKLKPSASNSK